jgi:hypothetical protein
VVESTCCAAAAVLDHPDCDRWLRRRAGLARIRPAAPAGEARDVPCESDRRHLVGTVALATVVDGRDRCSAAPWWLLILDVPAKSLFFTLVFQRTNGSVLIAAIFHGATNLFTVSPAFWTSEDWTLPVLATAAKWVLLLVIWLAARWHGHVLSSSKRPRSARAIKAR